MPVTRLEALVKANGVGRLGVQANIRKNRSTFQKMLSVFKIHFSVRNGIAKTAMAAPAPAETLEQRSLRLDRQLAESQRMRNEQDGRRYEQRLAVWDRLWGVTVNGWCEKGG